MRNNIRHFFQTLFPGQLEFKELINRMVMLLALASSLIGIVLVLLGANHRVLYALLPICVISGFSIWLTVTRHNSRMASWLLAIGTNMIFFPLLFITSGGTQSGMPVWLVLGVVYIFLLFEGRSFLFAITLSLLSFLGTYLVAYYRPEYVPDSTRFYSFSDSYIALICVSFFIGILLKKQAKGCAGGDTQHVRVCKRVLYHCLHDHAAGGEAHADTSCQDQSGQAEVPHRPEQVALTPGGVPRAEQLVEDHMVYVRYGDVRTAYGHRYQQGQC